MCSTPLSSGLLTSHVSSLSLPPASAVSNTQVCQREISQPEGSQGEVLCTLSSAAAELLGLLLFIPVSGLLFFYFNQHYMIIELNPLVE